ncbi:MAG: VOC family protein [Hyphomonadaceae bacterium]|nr:VOC family protein [Hyphomonadaceae bacterium]
MARVFRIVLPVSDIKRATAFYETVFAVKGERVSPGRHYVKLGDVILACVDAAAEADQKRPPPLSEHIYIAVNDLEGVWARARLAGAQYENLVEEGAGPLGVIATRPWGERSVYLKDPFGNPLCFVDERTVFRG